MDPTAPFSLSPEGLPVTTGPSVEASGSSAVIRGSSPVATARSSCVFGVVEPSAGVGTGFSDEDSADQGIERVVVTHNF